MRKRIKPEAMNILAIETSCDETAAAVLRGVLQIPRIKTLGSAVASQISLHAKTGGVVPEVAARAHVEKIIPVIDRALKRARLRLPQINAIAVTTGPGLATSLMVGADTAKALGVALKLPVIPINHIEAHVFSPFAEEKTVERQSKRHRAFSKFFPALSLVVSGGHTELVLVRDWLDYKKVGQTLDDAAGEAFDKIAKLLDLPYPGGPALSKLAENGKPLISFPRPMIDSKDFNFSFSGLKTAVLYYLRDHRRSSSPAATAKLTANIAASAQAAIVEVLVSKTLRAAKKYQARTILLGGGVAANKLLRTELSRNCRKLNLNFLVPSQNLCTDNAVMIGFTGYLHFLKKKQNRFDPLRIKINANWELPRR